MRLALGLALACLTAGASGAQLEESVPLVVEVETLDGEQWWTVHAVNVTTERFMSTIARRSGRRLLGLSVENRAALISVNLERRPLDQVLEYALGSVGLRYELDRDSLALVPSLSREPTRDERLDEASAAWIRATTRFPTHASAPSARLAQGELAELRGLLAAANNHYQSLVERYPSSKAASEALIRSGKIYKKLGQWEEASVQFRELAGREDEDEFQPTARLELAHCLVELGTPEGAGYLLDTLETQYPSGEVTVSSARLLVRTQVFLAQGRYLDALRLLDDSSASLDPLVDGEVLRLRALALEGVGMPGEAARAWLLHARDLQGERRTEALENAARLSLDVNDELGVLFLYKSAEEASRSAKLVASWKEARRRLGFETAAQEGAATIEERISAGERHLEQDEIDQATALFQPLFLARGALQEEQAARVCVGWASCVAQRKSLDEAIAVLADARSSLETLEARQVLDLGAARLLERGGRFEQAANAYRGVYAGRREER